jgi:hypothetical protein
MSMSKPVTWPAFSVSKGGKVVSAPTMMAVSLLPDEAAMAGTPSANASPAARGTITAMSEILFNVLSFQFK